MRVVNIDAPRNRDNFGSWLNTVKLLGTGVEVGALSGVYSKVILDSWIGQRLFLIDPWETQPVEIYREDDGRFNHKGAYDQALELSKKDPRAILLKGLSADVVHQFSNNTLDFVYIDANHAYENVFEDMTLWWEKVIPGGILCGHDFYNCIKHPFYNQVQQAVEDWSKQNGIDFCVTTECTSWWMPKPK